MKRVSLAVLVLAVASAAPPLGAQSLLHRSPNLGGTWTGDGGVVYFNFIHRFYVSPGPQHKVTNFPTFTLAVGLDHGFLIGTHYSSNSPLVSTPYRPNETEPFARWRWLGREGRNGLSAAYTAAYNAAARSFDSEVGADYNLGRLTLSGAVRFIPKPFGGPRRTYSALAGGVVARLNDYVAVSADYAKILNIDTTAAWSAGLDLAIPGSPHTFSLHASKAAANTIQGSSYGYPKVLYGFEFTIPLHLKRFAPWFHGGRAAPRGTSESGPFAATVELTSYAFRTDSITITAGQAVRWINGDPVEHTVTFDEGGVDSGTLTLNQIFVHRFERPGVYRYHCTPHSYMKGVVVVK